MRERRSDECATNERRSNGRNVHNNGDDVVTGDSNDNNNDDNDDDDFNYDTDVDVEDVVNAVTNDVVATLTLTTVCKNISHKLYRCCRCCFSEVAVAIVVVVAVALVISIVIE